MNLAEELQERKNYLENRINTLTIQCLATGFVPKIRTGKEMSKENLMILRTEIDKIIGSREKMETKLESKKTKKIPKANKKPTSSEDSE